MFHDYPDILTVPQVAKALGIGERAAYTLVKEKRLGAVYIGKNIKVPKICLIEFVKTACNRIKL